MDEKSTIQGRMGKGAKRVTRKVTVLVTVEAIVLTLLTTGHETEEERDEQARKMALQLLTGNRHMLTVRVMKEEVS